MLLPCPSPAVRITIATLKTMPPPAPFSELPQARPSVKIQATPEPAQPSEPQSAVEPDTPSVTRKTNATTANRSHAHPPHEGLAVRRALFLCAATNKNGLHDAQHDDAERTTGTTNPQSLKTHQASTIPLKSRFTDHFPPNQQAGMLTANTKML